MKMIIFQRHMNKLSKNVGQYIQIAFYIPKHPPRD